MNHKNTGLKTEPRVTDYVLGSSSPIPFKAVNPSGDWTPRLEFYEAQKYGWDSNGCVLFTAQESFDAQMDLILPTLPSDIEKQIFDMGFMDKGLDGNDHFHSSPRFLEILTGNGTNGNNLYDAWDVIRKYGVLPWKDLPFTPGMTQAEYFAPLPQMMLDKALKFRNLLGGKEFTKYHWVVNGGSTNIKEMQKALTQAPLCIGISVGNNWNVEQPPAPPAGSPPEHSVMIYLIDSFQRIYDHYLPEKKKLVLSYPVPYAMQGIVSPILTPAPTLPPVPVNVQPTQANVDILKIIVSLYQKLVSLYQQIKGRTFSSNNMNYSDLFKLNLADLAKAGVMAALAAGTDFVYQFIHACATIACLATFDFHQFVLTVSGAFFLYLTKNLFSTSDGKFLGKVG